MKEEIEKIKRFVNYSIKEELSPEVSLLVNEGVTNKVNRQMDAKIFVSVKVFFILWG